jgi:hypothetical protein
MSYDGNVMTAMKTEIITLTGIAALFLATGTAYAADTTETWDQGRTDEFQAVLDDEGLDLQPALLDVK